MALCAALLAGGWPAYAATFTVSTLADFSDDEPGDGECETVVGNPIDGFRLECSLRGAIEEANAFPGADVVGFDTAGTISVVGDALPAITEALTIDGSTAPGAPGPDRELVVDPPAPPPTLFISGSALPASDANGFLIDTGGQGTHLINIGITEFAGAGVALRQVAGVTETVISGCWIGLTEDRSPKPNGVGIDLGAIDGVENVRIGHDGTDLAGTGRGNVISGNSGAGVTGRANALTVRGNWIGSAGDGDLQGPTESLATVVANGGSAVDVTGTDITVDDNRIVGNGDPQVFLAGSNAAFTFNHIFGSTLDVNTIDDLESIVRGNSDGAVLLGSDLTVHNNTITANQTGLAFQSLSGGAADRGGTVADNEIFANALDGLWLRGVEAMRLDGNRLIGNGGYGARVDTNDNVFRGNVVGQLVSASESLGNVAGGLWLGGTGNRLEALPDGLDEEPNSLAGNGGAGVTIAGDNTTLRDSEFVLNEGAGVIIQSARFAAVTDNAISFTSSGILGSGYGVLISADSSDADVRGNLFAENTAAAIALDADAGESNLILSNAFLSVRGEPLDLGLDGPTLNDTGDEDTGANRLQNYPDLDNMEVDATVDPPTLTLEYRVDTSADASSLPITLEFYGSALGSTGGVSLHLPPEAPMNPLVMYNSPPAVNAVTLELTPGTTGGLIRAIAIDAAGNTSEFSPPIEFGERPDALFADSFEEPCVLFCRIGDPDCRVCTP